MNRKIARIGLNYLTISKIGSIGAKVQVTIKLANSTLALSYFRPIIEQKIGQLWYLSEKILEQKSDN